MNRSRVPYADLATFGDLLKFLRRRERLSQRELSIAVGYSESQISRLESNERVPDRTSLLALFVPALHIEDEPETVQRLVDLAEKTHVPLERQGTRAGEAGETKIPILTHEGSFPDGIVTFLFTDIVGSTPLWEQMPQEMGASVAQHHAILRQAIEANDGHVIQIVGDAFQAAFRLAQQGLQSALDAQRALCSAAWGRTGPIQVRIGLHTGPAELDPKGDAPYAVSHTLNRAARVMSAGHGGQILLSEEAAGLVRRSLPSGIKLKDLGEHRLKGMEKLEHIYQAEALDLKKDFPPLASQQSMRNHLPVQLTSFIGREEEVEEVCELLQDANVRLVTLTGEGGCGKTRLSLRAGEALAERFEHGVWLVELAPLSDPQLISKAVLTALGLPENGGDAQTQVLEFLRLKQMLLILDNCEHLIGAAGDLALGMLRSCPGVHILATSREMLGLPGEEIFRVLPLSLPAIRVGTAPTLAEIEPYEAIRLFVERAKSVERSFRLTDQNAPAVVRICQRLDGIPLAIELAAARTNILRPEQLLSRLEADFHLLASRLRGDLPHHQTLQATIDWSYRLLSEPERILLARLAVFAGGWTVDSAEKVAGAAPVEPEQVLDLLSGLVNKSLVTVDLSTEGEARYRMLETIRQAMNVKLESSGEFDRVASAHLAFFVGLAEQAEPKLTSKEQIRWYILLMQEQDNLRSALSRSLTQQRVAEGLRLAGALWRFWWLAGDWTEGSRWCKSFAELGRKDPGLVQHTWRARALLGLVSLMTFSGYSIDALDSYLDDALGIYQALGDVTGCGAVLCIQGVAEIDINVAHNLLKQGLELSYRAEDDWWIAFNKH